MNRSFSHGLENAGRMPGPLESLRASSPVKHRGSGLASVIVLGLLVFIAGCERPPVAPVQGGYRGVSMGQVVNPRLTAEQAGVHDVPPPIKPVRAGLVLGRAADAYRSVRVLGDLDIAEFGRTMNAITQWVAPADGGCVYCHVVGDFADDSKYTKVVARRMLAMVRDINSGWKSHVGETGVTCYTCHRGRPLPVEFWFSPVTDKRMMVGNRAGQNEPARSVGYTSLPNDPMTAFLVGSADIRIQSTAGQPSANHRSIKQAEWTYGLMVHMARSLGVNCTYCHNARAFADWSQSPPARAKAWYGIRMVRELNNAVLIPLAPVFPPNRLGPTGDGPKLNCATCHRGVYKPLYGVPMVKDYPGLYPPPGADAAGTVPHATATPQTTGGALPSAGASRSTG
jgi:photosynthetic reaction center cytochrome c subunit